LGRNRTFARYRFLKKEVATLNNLHHIDTETIPSKNENLNFAHCYFTRLNVRKMGPAFLGHPKQKKNLNSCRGFLRAALTGHSHPSPF
jgi:hypothetical protein